ncbi:hypothetical protein [Micromonospora sp. NPDC005237]|uniref:hypothetical protein n=1 Tax=Micromonospora sp. NPDC005237 TaxID=3155113 RepID=UPI0033BA4573
MATGRTNGLSTTQGHYRHAILLGNVPLARRLRARAELDRELGKAADDDVRPVRHGTTELAVVITATRDLELKPGEIDRLTSTAEGIARQWGIDLPVYRPGLIMRWRFEIAEGRWYGYPARRRWSAERMGAFVGWLRDDSTA